MPLVKLLSARSGLSENPTASPGGGRTGPPARRGPCAPDRTGPVHRRYSHRGLPPRSLRAQPGGARPDRPDRDGGSDRPARRCRHLHRRGSGQPRVNLGQPADAGNPAPPAGGAGDECRHVGRRAGRAGRGGNRRGGDGCRRVRPGPKSNPSLRTPQRAEQRRFERARFGARRHRTPATRRRKPAFPCASPCSPRRRWSRAGWSPTPRPSRAA